MTKLYYLLTFASDTILSIEIEIKVCTSFHLFMNNHNNIFVDKIKIEFL